MKTKICALGMAAGVLICAGQSKAQDSKSDWRRHERPGTESRPGSFAVELRFGPYWPQVDNEFPRAPGPYERIFDNDPQFYFGLEADWLPLRIPYVGMVGPGFGWGLTTATGTAIKSQASPNDDSETGDPSAETTLTIMPMHLSAVARFDELMLRTQIPVVPYAKFGIGLASWSASNVTGTSVAGKVTEGANRGKPCTPLDAEKETPGCVSGSDSTWGLHLALGGMLSLNWIEPRSANKLYEDVGVAHLYLFGEWMNAMLNGLGSRPQMRVGSSTVVVGMAADF